MHHNGSPTRILVIGGGFSGLTAGIEAAETGAEVIIVEKNPYLGGRVAQLNKYFPKICPPLCGLEINFRRIKVNPKITFYTMAQVESISGGPGDYTVNIKINPRYVNSNCTACNACYEACPVEIDSEFNFGLNKTKVIHLPFEQSFPLRYLVDRKSCPKDCPAPCIEACKYNAIDFNLQSETIEIKVDSIILATGWKPYDASKIDNLGFGKVKNVITNMMLERLASKNGPTGGQILRPSDGKPVEKIAFVQCAGSRDENHMPFCSYICCLASLKHTLYLKEQNPDAEVFIYYIDIRTPGRYEKFYNEVKEQGGVNLIKGKVAAIEQDPESDDVIVTVEDMLNFRKIKQKVDMVVLATGMQPEGLEFKVPGIKYAIDGFVIEADGIYSAGCAKNPMDVAGCGKDSTGAALKAIQIGGRR